MDTTISNEFLDKKRIDSWGILNGSCYICFSKTRYVIYMLVINNVDYNKKLITATISFYNVNNEPEFSVCEEELAFEYLKWYEDENNVYMIEKSNLALLQTYMCALAINHDNFSHFEEVFSKQGKKIEPTVD